MNFSLFIAHLGECTSKFKKSMQDPDTDPGLAWIRDPTWSKYPDLDPKHRFLVPTLKLSLAAPSPAGIYNHHYYRIILILILFIHLLFIILLIKYY